VLETGPGRILGEAPLAADGSFHLDVPADTPLQLQMLDADGLAVRTSAWIWARRHEARGCIGCHEDPERTPPNRVAEALRHPAVVLGAAEPPRTVDFRHYVLPLLERRCVACHGVNGAPPALAVPDGDRERAAQDVYARLLDGYVEPGRARASRLSWHLLGRTTSRPWDAPAGTARPLPPESALPAEELRVWLEWMDVGALWDAGAR
jgi:hypothetical protein